MIAALAALLLQAQTLPRSEETRVVAVAQAMFDALARGDRAAMRSLVLPGAVATASIDGEVRQVTMAEFIDTLPAAGPVLEERMYDPLVRVDGDVAMLWAAYDFRIDGQLSHCGSDLFDLVRDNGQWKVASLTWNQRKDCATR